MARFTSRWFKKSLVKPLVIFAVALGIILGSYGVAVAATSTPAGHATSTATSTAHPSGTQCPNR
jgi:hypothetical protein